MSMSDEKILEVLQRYESKCAYRLNDPAFTCDSESRRRWIKHLQGMISEMRGFLALNRREKLMRWLGFMQGAFAVLDVYTIDELKRHNMPSDATFEPGKPDPTKQDPYAVFDLREVEHRFMLLGFVAVEKERDELKARVAELEAECAERVRELHENEAKVGALHDRVSQIGQDDSTPDWPTQPERDSSQKNISPYGGPHSLDGSPMFRRGANWRVPRVPQPCFLGISVRGLDTGEWCVCCTKHVSKHFGGVEYRCQDGDERRWMERTEAAESKLRKIAESPSAGPWKVLENVPQRGRDFPCEECGLLVGNFLENGWYRCAKCGYPSK